MEIVRKLASVQRISELKPIRFINKDTGLEEVAENIQLAVVRGWSCVVLKSEFKEAGEFCAYIEIDSVIPRASWNTHLQKDKPDAPIRLRTMKLCKQLSQGLALPLHSVFGATGEEVLPNDGIRLFYHSPDKYDDFYLGDDITELLGVIKYEVPMSPQLRGIAKGNFPSFLIKTDQERLQNIPEILNRKLIYEVTEKIEGMSQSIYKKDGEIGVCSRNIDLKKTEDSVFWKAALKSGIIDKLCEYNQDFIAFQGELVGPGVEGNVYGLKEYDFYLYDIYDIREGRYFRPEERWEFAEKIGVKHVPIIHHSATALSTVEKVLVDAEGISKLADVQREGLVYKAHTEDISWKAISNKYLLKKKDK
jgi:hypothetical protein